MELQLITNQVKKRRIGVLVEEGLYDFTDDELKFIHESRDDDDDGENEVHILGIPRSSRKFKDSNKDNAFYGGSQNYQHSNGTGELAESENSDTESTMQYPLIWNHFNNGFLLEDADHEHESVGMVSSLSHSDFSEMETSDYDSDKYISAIEVVKNSVAESSSLASSSSDIDQQQQKKKRIIPEPWLSDTNYCMDESFEEQDHHHHASYYTPNSLREKISSFGNSIRKSYTGGFLGSYTIRKKEPNIVVHQVKHTGYLNVWSNLRNLHIFR